MTAADLGRTVACRITAGNAEGSGDATSEAVTVSNPAPAPAFTATPAPVTIAGPTTTTTTTKTTTAKAETVKYVPTCKLAGSKKAISCTVSVTPKTTAFTGAIRLQGVKQTAKSAKSKTGKVKLTVRSSKTLKRGQKVVLTLKSGKTTKVITTKTR